MGIFSKKSEVTLRINGMMCVHCSGRVKKALEAINGVESADVSFEQGTAVITLVKNVSEEMLIKTVEDAGYDVVK